MKKKVAILSNLLCFQAFYLPFFKYFGSWLHYNHKYVFVNEFLKNFQIIFLGCKDALDIIRKLGKKREIYRVKTALDFLSGAVF